MVLNKKKKKEKEKGNITTIFLNEKKKRKKKCINKCINFDFVLQILGNVGISTEKQGGKNTQN